MKQKQSLQVLMLGILLFAHTSIQEAYAQSTVQNRDNRSDIGQRDLQKAQNGNNLVSSRTDTYRLMRILSDNPPPQPLEIDAKVDQSKVDLNWWYEQFRAEYYRLAIPPILPPKVSFYFVENVYGGGCNGFIQLGGYPGDKYETKNIWFTTLMHEYGHSLRSCDASVALPFEESLVEAAKNLVYQELIKKGMDLQPGTHVFSVDILNNLPWNVAGGANHFYKNMAPPYRSGAGIVELLFARAHGGTFRRLLYELTQASGLMDFEKIPLVIDRAVGPIDGRPASEWVEKQVDSYLNGPDGEYFGIYPLSPVPGWQGNTTQAPVNPLFVEFVYFRRDNTQQDPNTNLYGKIKYSISNSDKVVVRSQVVDKRSGSRGIWIPDNNKLPEGSYVVDACVCDDNGACRPGLSDTSYFLVYRRPWTSDKGFLITNPAWGKLGNTPFRLTNDDSRLSIEHLPGLEVITLNGYRDDIQLYDEVTKRNVTITPHPNVSRIKLLSWRKKPLLNHCQDPMVPGLQAKVKTLGIENGTPAFLKVVDSIGQSFEPIPTNNTSFYEIQFTLPPQAVAGPAKIQITQSGTTSNTLVVEIRDEP